eukprot:GFYU01003937.1.p1 GENE.GFYU01003937.1~~GFYU01003937.1.p1  ORF type:complete len:343 (-),score=107.63 GFYU01003937.1:203-1231(-)
MGSSKDAYQKPEIQSVHYPKFKAALPSMKGKTVAITGTTTGVGHQAALCCAQLGADVILLNRKSERSEKALKSLSDAVPDATFTAINCDLQSFKSVEAAAEELTEEFDSLDVLINNAGVMGLDDYATKDGYDVQMQTNHLSHFLLTRELMPLLEAAAKEKGDARIVNHTSAARRGSKLSAKHLEKNGGDLGGDANGCMPFSGARWERYHQSKLANAVFTHALADKLKARGSKVKALVAHPGLAATNLQETTASSGGMGHSFTKRFMSGAQSIEDGAMGIIKCACDPSVQNGTTHGPTGKVTGWMKGPAKELPMKSEPKAVRDEKARDLLWTVSEKAVGEFRL